MSHTKNLYFRGAQLLQIAGFITVEIIPKLGMVAEDRLALELA